MEKQQTNKEIIPIFFATDDNYVALLSVALKSLIQNADKKYFYNIHILNSGLNYESVKTLKKFNDKNLVDIKFDNINEMLEGKVDNLHTRDYYSKATYYRFYIANLFPQYDKALYLDCDILILNNIADLYNVDLGNNLVGAINDETVTRDNILSEYVESLGIDRNKYFNAGILTINLKQFREENIEGKFHNLLDKYTFSAGQDQDYLNVLCKDRVVYIDMGWNKVPVRTEGFDENSLKLIHFKMIYRPWQVDGVMYGDKFWQYARRTPFFKQIVEMKKSFTEEQYKKGLAGMQNLVNICIRDTKEFTEKEKAKKLYA